MDGGPFEVSMTVDGRRQLRNYCFTTRAYLVDRSSALSNFKSLALLFAFNADDRQPIKSADFVSRSIFV